MYETETALPGEVEIVTPHGSLLAHRTPGNDVVLTTGLDRDRVVIGGRRVLVHLTLKGEEDCELAVFDADTRLYVYPKIYLAKPDFLPRSAAEAFIEECRTAVASAQIIPDVSDVGRLAHAYRENGRSLLDRVSDARMLMHEYESVRAHDRGDVPSGSHYSDRRNAQPVFTKWGTVHLKFEGACFSVSAGGSAFPPLERRRGFFGKQELSLHGIIDFDEDTGRFSIRNETGRPFFDLNDDRKGDWIRDQAFVDEVADEVLKEVRSLFMSDIRLMDRLRQDWREETASYTRYRLGKVREEVEKIAQSRLDMKARLDEAVALGCRVAELLPALHA